MKRLSVPQVFVVRLVVLAALVLLQLGTSGIAALAQSPEPAPNAGSWQTWVLASGDQFRVDAPPDAAATADEIAQLIEMAAQRDDTSLQQVAYWDAGAPVYRWNQIAMDALVKRGLPANLAYRDLALLNVAIYDATVAAWDSKFTYNRPRPSEVDPSLTTVIDNPDNPSYPSEYAVTAGAAAAILSWLFPEDALMFQDKAQEAVNSRLLAGVEYPSDVEAGLALGQQVAELVIEYGNADGTSAKWDGTVPTEPGRWTGENPVFPTEGTWKTWVLTSADQFRPVHAPPTTHRNSRRRWTNCEPMSARQSATPPRCSGNLVPADAATTGSGTILRAVSSWKLVWLITRRSQPAPTPWSISPVMTRSPPAGMRNTPTGICGPSSLIRNSARCLPRLTIPATRPRTLAYRPLWLTSWLFCSQLVTLR